MIHCATVDQIHSSNLMCSYSNAGNTVADLMVIFHWLTVWMLFVVYNWSVNDYCLVDFEFQMKNKMFCCK